MLAIRLPALSHAEQRKTIGKAIFFEVRIRKKERQRGLLFRLTGPDRGRELHERRGAMTADRIFMALVR